MKLTAKIFVVFIITVLALVVLWTKQASVDQSLLEPAPVYKSRELEGGGITMTITPKILTRQKPPSFEVILDTHSVDLSFDLADTAKLKDINKT